MGVCWFYLCGDKCCFFVDLGMYECVDVFVGIEEKSFLSLGVIVVIVFFVVLLVLIVVVVIFVCCFWCFCNKVNKIFMEFDVIMGVEIVVDV